MTFSMSSGHWLGHHPLFWDKLFSSRNWNLSDHSKPNTNRSSSPTNSPSVSIQQPYSSLSQNLIIYYVTSWFFFSMWLTREELYIQLFLVTQAWNLQIFIQNPRGNSQKNDGDCEGIQPKNALHSGLGIIGKSPRYLMFHIFAKELRNTFTNASFSLLLPFVQPCLRLARWNRIHWERSTGKRAKIKAVWRKTSLVSSVQNWVSFFLPNFCCLVCLIEFLP